MSRDIIIGRNEADRKKYGMKGTILIGKQYVTMGRVTSLSNNVFLDVAGAHVVFICGKRGGGKCLHGDTLITLDDGTQKPIKDLEDNDNMILALNKDYKIIKNAKSAFYKREVNKILKLTLNTGKEITLTPEHPLLTVKGWVPAEKLSIDSRIATPRIINAFGNDGLNESKTKILAYLLTEGHLNNGFVLFTNQDESIRRDFKKAIEDFDNKLIIKDHDASTFRIVENKKRTIIEQAKRNKKGQFIDKPKISNNRSSIRNWLDKLKLYGKLATERKIPDQIFNLPKIKTSLFLNRLFSCDGSIHKEGENYWKISYSTSSKIMIRQVQRLLLKFGIVSSVRCKKTKKNPSYEIIIRGEFVHTFINEIGFFGSKEKKSKIAIKETIQIIRNPNTDTIPKEIWNLYKPDNWAEVGRKLNYTHPKSLRESTRYSPSRQKLLQIAKADENELIEKFATSDIFWDGIKSIEVIEGKNTVYDITVPNLHNFVANDIIVHNSYTMGAIAEGFHLLEKAIKENLSIIMLDTMGIYWTMKYPNKQDKELLEAWGLKPQGIPVEIYTPYGFYEQFKKEGIPTDHPFSINPSELDQDDWCKAFKKDKYSEEGVLISRIILELKKENEKYLIPNILERIRNDEKADKNIRDKVESMFLMADNWGVFSEQGTPLSELAAPGKISVLDVSCYATMPGGWDVKSLIVGIVGQHLFVQRMLARKLEEYKQVHNALNYFSEDTSDEAQKMPLVWLVIDEAHEFLPREGSVASTDALVTIMREGRQPGISLILATQQPGKIHTDVMTQSDTVLSHRITAKIDVEALSTLMQSYMRTGLVEQLDQLPRVKGAGVIFDDSNEKMFPMRIRPRFTWHGGSSPVAVPKPKEYFEPEEDDDS